jgi:opacity protein-like surface antigen
LELEDTVGAGLSVSDTDLVLRFGGGLDFYTAENLLLFLEVSYFWTEGDIEDLDFIPVNFGVKYKF